MAPNGTQLTGREMLSCVREHDIILLNPDVHIVPMWKAQFIPKDTQDVIVYLQVNDCRWLTRPVSR